MRIAILSDIHGNTIALEAVLADIQQQGGVDSYWILGDFCAFGYDPAGALERVTALPNASFTRGNTDRNTINLERGNLLVNEAQANPEALPRLVDLVTALSWTQGVIEARDWWDWLAELPLEVRLTLPDGTHMLGVHAAPGLDDGPGINPGQSDEELRTILAPAQADLVFVGHTHFPLDRTVDGVRVINLGSVSNPVTPSLQASYALLQADTTGYQLEMRFVDYDREAVIAAIQRVHHPSAAFLTKFMRGEMLSRWAQKTSHS